MRFNLHLWCFLFGASIVVQAQNASLTQRVDRFMDMLTNTNK